MVQPMCFSEAALPATGKNGFDISSKLCSEILAENYKNFRM